MVHCQECGSSNASDARFCNQCGARIAQPGEPGGPIEEAAPEDAPRETTLRGHAEPRGRAASRGDEEAPRSSRTSAAPKEAARSSRTEGLSPSETSTRDRAPSQLDASTVSLAAIGVRSRGTAWGIFIGAALGLIGTGALGMWLIQSQSQPASEPVAEATEPTTPTEPEEVEVGDPIPQGNDVPEVDFVPGSPRPTTSTSARDGSRPSGSRRPTTGSTSGTGERPATGSQSGTPSGGAPSRGTQGGAPSGGTPSGGTPSGGTPSGGTPSGGTPSGGTPSGGTPSGGTPSGGTPSGGTQGGTPGSDTIDWEAFEEEQQDPMEEYSVRVRNVIRTYYAPRAQTCFERETRNRESVRGTVVVAFRVLADGEIDNARVTRNTTGIETLGACLARSVDSWRLPPPPEAPLPMEMPFSR
jgi:hypothetical protein